MAMSVLKPYQKALLIFLAIVWAGFAVANPLRAEGDGKAAGQAIQVTVKDAILMALENNQSHRQRRHGQNGRHGSHQNRSQTAAPRFFNRGLQRHLVPATQHK